MKNLSVLSTACFAAFAAYPAFAVDLSNKVAAAEINSIGQHVQLKEVVVKGSAFRRPALERVTRDTISREMINDTKDLVRYSADVGVSDDGRRTKGFAMRGVEENRVGISIDGVSLPESEENSLFARYGNFNNSRMSIDPELVRNIEVTKGADSINSGSGALGGNVNYRTLNGKDLVGDEGKFGGILKRGYASKNSEWVDTVGFGFNNGDLDAAVLYSHRYGHELRSRGGDVAEYFKSYASESEPDRKRKTVVGSSRITPDPSTHDNHSWLAKLSYRFNPDHRVGISVNGQKSSNFVNEYSYSLTTYWRDAEDIQERTNANVFYEFTPESEWLSLVRADLDYQKTENASINFKGTYDSEWVHVPTRWHHKEYVRGWMQNRDFRNNKTDFYRLSLNAETHPLQWGSTTHELSVKASASRREFENVNTDQNLDRQGNVTRTEIYTIQYPVTTDHFRLAVQDKFRLNESITGHLGAAYDYTKVNPENSAGIPCGKASGSFGRLCAENAMGTTFKDWSLSGGLNWHFHPNWTTGYSIATGYRVPTASEMYFSFQSAYGNWLSNPNLKSERSTNHNVFIQGRGELGRFDASLYHTRYRDFLYEQETMLSRTDESCSQVYADAGYCNRTVQDYFQQMVNLDRARVSGVEFTGRLNLDKVMNVSKGWSVLGSLGYSKGNMDVKEGRLSMLSIQPLKVVLGLDYEHPDEKYGIFSRLTFTGSKRAKDAQEGEYTSDCVEWRYDDWYKRDICRKYGEAYRKIIDYRFLSKRALVLDTYGYYRPTKNLTLRAGVYNVFDTKYHTWDSLRGINTRYTINSMSLSDIERGNYQGLERYYAPGRNFAVALEYKF